MVDQTSNCGKLNSPIFALTKYAEDQLNELASSLDSEKVTTGWLGLKRLEDMQEAMRDIRGDVKEIGHDLDRKLTDLHMEDKAEFGIYRTENGNIRTEVVNARTEVRTEIGGLRGEMGDFRAEVSDFRTKTRDIVSIR